MEQQRKHRLHLGTQAQVKRVEQSRAELEYK